MDSFRASTYLAQNAIDNIPPYTYAGIPGVRIFDDERNFVTEESILKLMMEEKEEINRKYLLRK